MTSKIKKIAVLGGAGLIGSYLVELLVDKGHKVVVIDDFSKGKIENLSKIKHLIKIRRINIENKKNIYKSLKDCRIFFHLASRVYGVGYSKNNHSKIFLHNEKITNNLLSTLKKIKIDYFQCVSSSCVYDDKGPKKIKEELEPKGIPEKLGRTHPKKEIKKIKLNEKLGEKIKDGKKRKERGEKTKLLDEINEFLNDD